MKKTKVAIIVPRKKLLALGSMLWMQRYGPLQVASVVKDAGYSVSLFNEELGIKISTEKIAKNFNVIGISAKTCAISRAEEIVADIKKINQNAIVVLGGEHASMHLGQFSKHFDFVLRGEAEMAFLEILARIENENKKTNTQQIILPKHGFYQCKSFDNIPDLSLIEGFADIVNGFTFKHFPMLWVLLNRKITRISFQGTRGCPYGCSFCPTAKHLQGKNYRRRSIESAIAYLQKSISQSGIRRIVFEDPIAAISGSESYVFFKAIAESSIKMKATALVRVDICADRKLLKVMYEAGVRNLSLGIESLNEQTLSLFDKRMTADTIKRAIETLHRFGFSLTALFIVGNDNDDLDFSIIEKFIISNGIEHWRISPYSQVPEQDNQFMPAYRFFRWNELDRFGYKLTDFLNGEFVCFFPKNKRPSTLQEEIMQFNISCSNFANLLTLAIRRRRIKPFFRGLTNNVAQKAILREINRLNYIEMLQKIEQPFYSSDGILNEKNLRQRFV